MQALPSLTQGRENPGNEVFKMYGMYKKKTIVS
jgi:hypothetical protein